MAKTRVASHALVTGASTGIGKVFASELASRGSDLVLVARDKERLERLAEELRKVAGRKVEVMCADLTDRGQLAAVEQRLREDVSIDLLVNNAGFGVAGGFSQVPIESSQGQIDLNVTALTRLAHAAVPGMKAARRGGIINVASGGAFLPSPDFAVYCATKAYVVSFTQGLHEELRSKGVTVTVVCPGFTRTEFQQRANYDVSAMPDMVWQTPEAVVAETLDAFAKGSVICIPGVQNRVTMGLMNLVPRSLIARVVSKMSPPGPRE